MSVSLTSRCGSLRALLSSSGIPEIFVRSFATATSATQPRVDNLRSLRFNLSESQELVENRKDIAHETPVETLLLDAGTPAGLIQRIKGVEGSSLLHDDVEKVKTALGSLLKHGVPSAAVGRVLVRVSGGKSLPSEEPVKSDFVEFMNSIGIFSKLGRVLTSQPSIATMKVESLQQKVAALEGFGLCRVGELVIRHPALLSYSVENRIQPVIEFLKSEVNMTDKDVAQTVASYPAILGYSMENLHSKVDFYKAEFGDIKSPAKFVRFPHYFGYSLKEKIMPRLKFLKEHRGVGVAKATAFRKILRGEDSEFALYIAHADPDLYPVMKQTVLEA